MSRKYKGKQLLSALAPADDTLEITGAELAAATLTGATVASGSLKSTENLPTSGVSLVSGETVVPNTSEAVLTTDREKSIRYVRLTLTAFSVAVAESDDYGSTKICDLSDNNLMILSCEATLLLTKGNTGNGLVAATDMTVAIGSAAASNSTLSSTMVDVLDLILHTDNQLTHQHDKHSQENTAPNMPLEIQDGAGSALYLNCAASITADDTFTATGTIDLYYVDLGNVTS